MIAGIDPGKGGYIYTNARFAPLINFYDGDRIDAPTLQTFIIQNNIKELAIERQQNRTVKGRDGRRYPQAGQFNIAFNYGVLIATFSLCGVKVYEFTPQALKKFHAYSGKDGAIKVAVAKGAILPHSGKTTRSKLSHDAAEAFLLCLMIKTMEW